MTNRVHTLPSAPNAAGQLVGQLPSDEHQGVDMMSGIVEHVHGDQPAWWLDGVGRTIVATTGNAMGELALSTEPWPTHRQPSSAAS